MIYRGVHTLAIPPGETIKEQLENWEIPPETFPVKMGMTAEQIERLIEGDIPVTDEIAAKLSPILGMPPYFWTGLERGYQADLVKAKAENEAKAARVNRYADFSMPAMATA